jgi:hypothetical protein
MPMLPTNDRAGKSCFYRFNRQRFPLVKWYYYTGEKINPWRCELCVTKKQKAKPVPNPDMLFKDLFPACCNKCGMDLY